MRNNAVFRTFMENVIKHIDINRMKTEAKRNYLLSEPNFYATKNFSDNLLAIEMKKKYR